MGAEYQYKVIKKVKFSTVFGHLCHFDKLKHFKVPRRSLDPSLIYLTWNLCVPNAFLNSIFVFVNFNLQFVFGSDLDTMLQNVKSIWISFWWRYVRELTSSSKPPAGLRQLHSYIKSSVWYFLAGTMFSASGDHEGQTGRRDSSSGSLCPLAHWVIDVQWIFMPDWNNLVVLQLQIWSYVLISLKSPAS